MDPFLFPAAALGWGLPPRGGPPESSSLSVSSWAKVEPDGADICSLIQPTGRSDPALDPGGRVGSVWAPDAPDSALTN